jgi:hypothetical protein
MDRPHFLPAHDIPSLLLYSAHGSDVVMTMVDGKILYENGVFLTIDFEKAKFDLDAAKAFILERKDKWKEQIKIWRLCSSMKILHGTKTVRFVS